MINCYERMYVHEERCNKTASCFNEGTDKCAKCMLSNHNEGWLMYDNYEYVRAVGATIDGTRYPWLSGWYLTKEHGLVSKGTYVGTDGEQVSVGGELYFKVILPTDREIQVYPSERM